MTAAVYPLRPGRPLLRRLTRGRWTWECHCGPLARTGGPFWVRSFRDSFPKAVQEATDHARHAHDPLALAYFLPAAEYRCVCCGQTGNVRYWNYLSQPFCWPCADAQCTHPAT